MTLHSILRILGCKIDWLVPVPLNPLRAVLNIHLRLIALINSFFSMTTNSLKCISAEKGGKVSFTHDKMHNTSFKATCNVSQENFSGTWHKFFCITRFLLLYTLNHIDVVANRNIFLSIYFFFFENSNTKRKIKPCVDICMHC